MRARLSVLTSEAMAMARQAWLLPHDAFGSVMPRADDERDVVVFLHGLFASAGVLRPLRARVTKNAGLHTAALSYAPGPSIEELSSRLGALIDKLNPRARVHLVGHSLGGVVARHFAHQAGDERIAQTVSLASPFAGVPRASWLGLDFAKDLDPQSTVLRNIRLNAATFSTIPHLSIVAKADTVIPTPVAQALPFGDVVILDDIGHNALLFNPEVATLVEARIRAHRS